MECRVYLFIFHKNITFSQHKVPPSVFSTTPSKRNTHASNNNHEQQKKYIDRIHYVWDGFGQESWSCVVIYNMKLD
jgi:hypothetical protein